MNDKGGEITPARLKRIGLIVGSLVIVASIVFALVNQGTQQTDEVKSTETTVAAKSDDNSNNKNKSEDKKSADDDSEKAEGETSSATDTTAGNTSAANNESSANKKSATPDKQAKKKKWVEPVYKEVHHPEEGHYEALFYCRCYDVDGDTSAVFTTEAGWASHRQDFIDKNGSCNGHHRNYRKKLTAIGLSTKKLGPSVC